MNEPIQSQTMHRAKLQLRANTAPLLQDRDWQPLRNGPWQAAPRRTRGAQEPDIQRIQLAVLCAELDRRLRRPITARTLGHIRQVMVLGCIGYTLDLRDKSVRVQRFFRGQAVDQLDSGMQLLGARQPVVRYVMEEIGLSQCGHQATLLLSPGERAAADDWLAANAARLLQQDRRYTSISVWRILNALNMEGALIGLMLAARTDTQGGLPISLSTRVWRHEGAFRRAASTNPHLLPLLAACAAAHGIKRPADPIGEMRAHVIEADLTKAAWRYLVQHGAKPFRAIWREDALYHHRDWRDALQYLRLLERIGFPDPAPAVVRALLDFHAALQERPSMASFYGDWCVIPDHVLAPILHESTACRRAGRASPDADTLEKVFVWAYETQRDLQAPSTLQWGQVLRRAEDWHAQRCMQVEAAGLAWDTHIGPHAQDGYLIQPLNRAIELIVEGLVMRHCIETYIDDCLAGKIRVFSFRNARTGKRIATATIQCSGEGQWRHHDAKRKANCPAPEDVHRLTVGLARRYTQLAQDASRNAQAQE